MHSCLTMNLWIGYQAVHCLTVFANLNATELPTVEYLENDHWLCSQVIGWITEDAYRKPCRIAPSEANYGTKVTAVTQ